MKRSRGLGDAPKRSPLAPKRLATLPALGGVALSVAETGMKYRDRPDLLLATFDEGTSVAGVLTRSKAPSAPVDWCRDKLAGGRALALMVNAGNANAFTGKAGRRAVNETAAALAKTLGCRQRDIFLASTGVIGEPLDTQPMVSRMADMAQRLSPSAWEAAARAIMTTDTFPKLATTTAKIAGKTVTINGIVKGSGMIAPDMATMLGFVFTDAAIAPDVLQALLTSSVERSFNATTVDGDTSTSDTVLAFATGAAGAPEIKQGDDPRLRAFAQAFDRVCLDLAHQVVRDGEGATKFIAIEIAGAEDDGAARRIGLTVANSPLVKTAIAGEDANWGRVVMAIGKSGEAADRDKISIRIGGISVAKKGAVDPDYEEKTLVPHMKGNEIDIHVHVGVGRGRATVWTCDLTHGYISINADYRS